MFDIIASIRYITKLRMIVVGSIAIALAVLGTMHGTVLASDNDPQDPRHWHSEAPTYQLAGSLPTGWDTEISN